MRAGYDYIIVGAGSAGCVLANRLTEDTGATVLLLEAGGSDSHPYIQIPLGLGKLQQHKMFDWGYMTEPEPNLNNRQLPLLRGKVLGGSSSINVMAYTRGHRADFDRWSREGATGWSYADALPYFKRSELWELGEDPWRGGTGPLDTQATRDIDPLFDALWEAGQLLGWPTTDDPNAAELTGLGYSQLTIRRGRRASASSAYLKPASQRPNLTLRTNALATKVIMRGTRATGIEFVHNGATQHAEAKREVLLCGGVFNSPQLLMLSGIGPPAHLKDNRHHSADRSPGRQEPARSFAGQAAMVAARLIAVSTIDASRSDRTRHGAGLVVQIRSGDRAAQRCEGVHQIPA